MTAKVLFTGKTHNTGGRDGGTRSSDGFLDLKLSQPHPAAENLFGAAWSACYIGALELAAGQQKIALPAQPTVDAEIDLVLDGGAYSCSPASMSACRVSTARSRRTLIDAAHTICPYSKATHGNIAVETNLRLNRIGRACLHGGPGSLGRRRNELRSGYATCLKREFRRSAPAKSRCRVDQCQACRISEPGLDRDPAPSL